MALEFSSRQERDECVMSECKSHASSFQFIYNDIIGNARNHTINVTQGWEGKMVMFPATLLHTVYPFYGPGERRSFSFNADIAIKK